jgi:tetratricopeptide (TPR) repeat protein/tRNA A-37 threonylcarbamoyl transferase component Bud32
VPPPRRASAPAIAGVGELAVLGAGGFATVFAGRDGEGRLLAVKVAHEAHDRRFEREVEALQRIGPPAVPALFGRGATPDGRSYLLEERLLGRTLAQWLTDLPGAGAASCDVVARLAAAVCGTLARVHGAGIVHRDLKPENIFLRASAGEAFDVTLIDFGLARPIGDPPAGEAALELTRTGQQLGSYHYTAPEQLADARQVDQRADVYALGAILYECLTGRPPFVGDHARVRHAHANLRPRPPSERVAAAAPLDAVVLGCLAKDPDRRYPDATAVAEAVGQAMISPRASVPVAARASGSPSSRMAALVGVRSQLPVTEVAAAAEAEGGHLSRTRDDGYLLLFPQIFPEAAVAAAWRTGVELLQRLTPSDLIVLHAAELRVRDGARGVVALGAALDAPSSWWPSEVASSGAIITPAAAAFLGGRTLTAPTLATPASSTQAQVSASTAPPVSPVPVIGRETLLTAMRAEAESALGALAPALTTLVGEVGHGKTRILDALAEELAPRARIVRVAFLSPEAAEVASGAAVLSRALGLSFSLGGARYGVARAIADGIRQGGPTVLLVDDAQWADPCALDALELATMEDGAALWVAVATGTELLDRRPLWGERALSHTKHQLGPLDEASELALLRHLFFPAESIPAEILRAVREMARGVPLFAVELAHALRAAGAVRPAPSGGGWYLAGDDLLGVSATPLATRLAERQLAKVPPALRGFVELCAVLGDGFTRDDAVAAEHAVTAADSGPTEPIDPDAALARLRRLGVLRDAGEGHYFFRHPMLRKAVEEAVPSPRRRQLHRLMMDVLSARPGVSRAVIARHATRCDAHEEAFENHFALAEEARTSHQYVTADEHYSAALIHVGDDDPRRGPLLAGRGKVRYRVQRFAEAISDLHTSRAYAEAKGDGPAIADLLLEEATIEDWRERWASSLDLVEQASGAVDRSGDEALEARWLMARGRSEFRAGRLDAAVFYLDKGQTAARRTGDHETWSVSSMLLGTALVSAGRLDDAEARFAEVIESCGRERDTLHLCSAYNNRIWLWFKREAMERAIADQRRATALAREIGHVMLERSCTYNLAELLYWRGHLEEALGFARRARDLQARFLDDVPLDALLMARISAARGDRDVARSELDWVLARCPEDRQPPLVRTQVRLVQLLASEGEADAAAWDALVEQARGTTVLYELHEVLEFAAAEALRRGDGAQAARYADEGLRLSGESHAWRERFVDLAAGAGPPLR